MDNYKGSLLAFPSTIDPDTSARLQVLVNSQSQFLQFAHHLDVVIWVADQATRRTVYVSPAYENIWGRTVQSFYDNQESFFDAVHPDDVKASLDAVERQWQGDQTDTEYRILRPDGEIRWIWDRAFPIRGPKGETSIVAGIAVDITQRKQTEEDLRHVSQSLGAIIDASPLGILILNREGHVQQCNLAIETIFGWTADEIMGRIPPWVQEGTIAEFRSLMKGTFDGKPLSGEHVTRQRKDGSLIHLELYTASLPNLAAGRDEVITLMADVTERTVAQTALRDSEERFRSIFEDAPIGISLISEDYKFLKANKALCTLLGYSERELTQRTITDITHPDDVKADLELASQFPNAISKGSLQKRFLRKDGSVVWCKLTATVVRDEDGNPKYGVEMVEDVTEQRRAEEGIRHIAFHDMLTELPNRTAFEEHVSRTIRKARKDGKFFCLLFLDLDYFKVVNDTLGHDAGDELLTRVAEKLRSIISKEDHVARVGGDEFTILLGQVDSDIEALGAAKRIIESFHEPWAVNGKEIVVTASIGISAYPRDAGDVQSLLSRADAAMYHAKQKGRDRVEFFRSFDRLSGTNTLDLRKEIRQAVEREEFVLHYQPIASVKNGQITAVEALVRWQHPSRGLLLPHHFIPFAEETGVIETLGEWVLRQAIVQGARWVDAGKPSLRISVNVSNRQLMQESFVSLLKKILTETGFQPTQLEIEWTEGITSLDVKAVSATLQRLHQMGVKIALDDFGISNLSLIHLRKLPISALKIDRSLIRHLPKSEIDSGLVAGLIGMAHNLRLRVVAEGVESEEQLAFLADHGCGEFQGYLLGRPKTSDKVFLALQGSARDKRHIH